MPPALSFPSPPPSPSPPLETLTSEPSNPSYSYNPSLLIIAGILIFVFLASASIHLLLRVLSRSSSSSSPPIIHRNISTSTTSTSPSSSPTDQDQKALLDSLPVFSLASLAHPRPSADCAVCLSRFDPHDELRLLPACRHAFHSPCIDAWIRSTPSCPLCRSSIAPPPPPSPPPPPEDPARDSGSFRVEIGSVSRRSDGGGAGAPPRSYSVGSSFEYMVEEDVEAVVARVRRGTKNAGEGPPPPGVAVAEAAGGEGKGWLKEYVDRLASSASSSFSSLRFSAWGSRRFDGGGSGEVSWNLESDGGGEESGYFASSYRWRTGAH